MQCENKVSQLSICLQYCITLVKYIDVYQNDLKTEQIVLKLLAEE